MSILQNRCTLNQSYTRLLDTYLDGLLDKEEYRIKKEELLDRKTDIKADLDRIRRNPDFRFELAKDLFSDCFFVDKIISERNLPAGNAFLRKSGLNHILKEKSLSFSWAIPYAYVAEGNRKIKILVNNYRQEINEPCFSESEDIEFLCKPDSYLSERETKLKSAVRKEWSGWSDLNRRPLRPERSALAKLRHTPIINLLLLPSQSEI